MKRKKILFFSLTGIVIFSGIWFYNCLPAPLFRSPVSTVLLDRNGQLLGATIAADGQWRFPASPKTPDKFKTSIIAFEDKRFFDHHGVDILATCRAIRDNIQAGKVKSGSSTISMQVIRLSRKGQRRTIGEKILEMLMALRLELSFSKEDILSMYASNAPFGSNVVGLDAAAWRYYGKSANELSWGESAALAVLPNNPSIVRPGKNTIRFSSRKNYLLDKLLKNNKLDSVSCMLAQREPLPDKPYALPHYAPHLLTRFNKERNNLKSEPQIITTIDKSLQQRTTEILIRHHNELKSNGINNIAALIADVETGNVIAYVGNIKDNSSEDNNGDVDIITSSRSTGSILKPFLFSAMIDEGEILPTSLIADIPTQIAGYSPQNFNRDYDGAVPAKRALERSLNVPAVRMLRTYGTGRFNYLLKNAGMKTLTHPADHYGLSIILGGAEGNLWDIAGMYAGMARTLNHFGNNSGRYDKNDFHPLKYIPAKNTKDTLHNNVIDFSKTGLLSASAIWSTFNAMEEVNRPEIENNWNQFSSSHKIAWKTGTSFGFRDGWAIGCTPDYVVAVWTGNADGEGRPGLIGISTAAPAMFDIFKLLSNSGWFLQPYDEMQKVAVCHHSGYRALAICAEKDSVWIPIAGLKSQPCPYHQIVHLDHTGRFRVTEDCESPSDMKHQSWFVLPPAQEWYYKSKNHQYTSLPPFKENCNGTTKNTVMDFIYPKKSTQIYIPVELDGNNGNAIFQLAHRDASALIYWHLDEDYIGSTRQFHKMALNPKEGKHVLAVVDENGERMELNFEIISKKN
jgi:penicillin-binding protein 1C